MLRADLQRYPILYVDDEQANLDTMAYVLGTTFHVETCGSGEEALERLRRKEYAVLLADQRMPGLTGVEVCQRAKELAPDTVRVIVTAYADARAVEAAVNYGAVSRYIRKPHRADEIANVMRDAIDIHRGRIARREVEAYLLRTAPKLAVRGVEADVGENLMALLEPLHRRVEALEHALEARGASELDTHVRHIKTSTEAVYSYGVRLCMGSPEQSHARSNLGDVMDATVRTLREAVERIASLNVRIDSAPTVPLESATASHVIVHLLAAIVDSIEEDGGEGAIEMTLQEDGNAAHVAIRYAGIASAGREVRDVGTEPPTFRTVRHLIEEAGGAVRYEGAPRGTSISIQLPKISD
ncbi:MAG: response regulator [Myxococcota bacterium]